MTAEPVEELLARVRVTRTHVAAAPAVGGAPFTTWLLDVPQAASEYLKCVEDSAAIGAS